MANSIKKIASYVYCSGILSNVIICVRNENLKLDREKNQNQMDITVVNYGYSSFVAACIGTVSGLTWPITFIGRLSVMIVPK